jgi:hypothetical protein
VVLTVRRGPGDGIHMLRIVSIFHTRKYMSKNLYLFFTAAGCYILLAQCAHRDIEMHVCTTCGVCGHIDVWWTWIVAAC